MRLGFALLVSAASILYSCGRFDTQNVKALNDIQETLDRQAQLSSVDVDLVSSQGTRMRLATETPSLAHPDASGNERYCPSSFEYSREEKLCVNASEALGPFTREMISLCKKYGGGESACESQRWSRSFAAKIRQSAECPLGSELDLQLSICRAGDEVFGPFSFDDVQSCRAKGGASVCETMRWHQSFITSKPATRSTNQKLFDYYSKRENYNQVFSDVLRFYPTGRSNGCVAFMSSALRRVGVNIPINGYIGGESVSLVTKPFAQYLRQQLGWQKIEDANSLQPGDVVLTEDDARYPGYPAHTYMFYGWSDQRAGIGWVIDNQDFIHERNIFGYGTYNFTPFAYALRSLE